MTDDAINPMQDKPFQPQLRNRTPGAGFGRMLVFSLGLHLVLIVLFAGGLLPRAPKKLEPLYYIDLANLPVRNPQAGRPDGRPKTEKKADIAPTPAPTAIKPPAPPPPEVPPKAPAKPAPKIETPPVATAKPATQKPPVATPPQAKAEPRTEKNYSDTLNVIEKLRREQEIAKSKADLAAMAATDARPSEATEAPLGVQAGQGTEAGPDEREWIRKYLKESWNLSKYQVTRRDLKAQTEITFDAGGQLLDYKILESSGDATFDDSVRRAILKAKQLPFQPERRLKIKAEFNLKDLLE
ncbi:MAG: TonB family protein [Desulfuromonadales bacterium]